jgi:hypothetical protein
MLPPADPFRRTQSLRPKGGVKALAAVVQLTTNQCVINLFQMLPIRRLSVFAAWKAAVNLTLGLSLVLPGSP